MNENLILILSNALTGIASFLVSKRMSNAQTDNQILKNLELAMGVYQTLCENLKDEIVNAYSQVVPSINSPSLMTT